MVKTLNHFLLYIQALLKKVRTQISDTDISFVLLSTVSFVAIIIFHESIGAHGPIAQFLFFARIQRTKAVDDTVIFLGVLWTTRNL